MSPLFPGLRELCEHFFPARAPLRYPQLAAGLNEKPAPVRFLLNVQDHVDSAPSSVMWVLSARSVALNVTPAASDGGHPAAICSTHETKPASPFFHRPTRLESRAVARLSARGEPEALSSREREVLRYLVRGHAFAEAARGLGLPISEVEHLHASICRKLDLRGRPTVYEYAVAIGLVRRNSKA